MWTKWDKTRSELSVSSIESIVRNQLKLLNITILADTFIHNNAFTESQWSVKASYCSKELIVGKITFSF